MPRSSRSLQNIHQWNGDGLTPPVTDFGAKIPSNCFSYFKINSAGSGFTRVYPAQPNTFDCTSGTLNHY